MHDLPRQLSPDDLAVLFEGRTRLVERLARREHPLSDAAALRCAGVPEDELIEALNAHPRIGERTTSASSDLEQGREEDPVVLAELAQLNRLYEEKFGFRFVVFVNRRARSEILGVLRERIHRTREEELRTAIDDLVAIARDRYRTRKAAP
jgi:2-oxo-4-hydroxy-4-carboxy--5-ureidoimidazoline (OHCU) decarboxylase